MQSEFNNLQSDWLNQAEELNDNDAAQVNGGIEGEDSGYGNSGTSEKVPQLYYGLNGTLPYDYIYSDRYRGHAGQASDP